MSVQHWLVMVVDDDPLMLKAIEHLLTAHGFDVETHSCLRRRLSPVIPDQCAEPAIRQGNTSKEPGSILRSLHNPNRLPV
jgi:CheY-like chemotaxis protein